MTQRKQIAKGSKLLIGTAPSGTLAAYGRVETINLPPEDYETYEAPELNPQDDTGASVPHDPVELGDEILGELAFVHYWDPMDTDATQLKTYWAAKTELVFAFDTPHATGGARITFRGRLKMLEPEEIAKKNYFKRRVVAIRTSSITVAARPA